jgi:hypothetical protein
MRTQHDLETPSQDLFGADGQERVRAIKIVTKDVQNQVVDVQHTNTKEITKLFNEEQRKIELLRK